MKIIRFKNLKINQEWGKYKQLAEIPQEAEPWNIVKCFCFIFEFSQWVSYFWFVSERFHKELARNSQVFYYTIVS